MSDTWTSATILSKALRAFPALKFPLAIAAVYALVAFAAGLKVDLTVGITGTIIAIALSFVMIVLARAASSAGSYFRGPIIVALWLSIILLFGNLFLFSSSLMFGWPSPFHELLSFGAMSPANDTTSDHTETQPIKRASTPAEITECDRLAAAPYDPEAVADGVSFADMNTEVALKECEKAVQKYGRRGRLLFQLARVSDAMGDCEEAIEGYLEAAKSGSGAAYYSLGDIARKNECGDMGRDAAFPAFNTAYNLGVSLAANEIGRLFSNGIGVVKDSARACEWYKKSADSGSAAGMFNLAVCFDEGGEKNDGSWKIDSRIAADNLLISFRKCFEAAHRHVRGELAEWSPLTRKEIERKLIDVGVLRGAADEIFDGETARAFEIYNNNHSSCDI